MYNHINKLKIVSFTFFVMIVFSLIVASAVLLPSRNVVDSDKAATLSCTYPTPPPSCTYQGADATTNCGAKLICTSSTEPSSSPNPACTYTDVLPPAGCSWYYYTTSDTNCGRLPACGEFTNTTPTVTSVSCGCSENACTGLCKFSANTTGTLSSPYKCSLEQAQNVSPIPTQNDYNSFCNRPNRTLGDADGDSKVDDLDYFYYVKIVNGGVVKPNINADFNGDGVVSISDRVILIQSIKNL